MAAPRRNILVVGATGKQGGATVRALLAPGSPPDFHVWGMTRNSTGALAKGVADDARRLNAEGRFQLVEGNLEDAEGVRKVFEMISAEGGIWGVFVAIAFPGLGVKDDREKDQGIMLANLALEFGVEAFVYSSALQPAADEAETPEYSRLSKQAIERHCKSLTEKGLKWTIIQPGFFMENLEGMLGSIAISLFLEGLKKDTTICLIASEDIGRVAGGVFADHEKYVHKVVGLAADPLTAQQIVDAHDRAVGTPITRVPPVLARLLLWLNADARGILHDLEMHQKTRNTGAFPTFEEEVHLGHSVCKLQTFEEWVRTQQKNSAAAAAQPGWNKVSLVKILTGRS
ncbi:NAD(P)-binding protein [Podospora aff. communis PSN243]|uniref:NAD(P)-binding protein n=1 Tax=Podospora aff. communis PSN243 TaxID=3040156 RepID=A0AAV9G7W1_9PEZI|nr:NAD(P)-binding protein [Podospora aff. communis PSN243]